MKDYPEFLTQSLLDPKRASWINAKIKENLEKEDEYSKDRMEFVKHTCKLFYDAIIKTYPHLFVDELSLIEIKVDISDSVKRVIYEIEPLELFNLFKKHAWVVTGESIPGLMVIILMYLFYFLETTFNSLIIIDKTNPPYRHIYEASFLFLGPNIDLPNTKSKDAFTEMFFVVMLEKIKKQY